MLVYELEVEPLGRFADVATRNLSTKVNGESKGEVKFPKQTIKIGGLKYNAGDEVEIELRDEDAAGNISEPAVYRFTATDTIAPDAPSGLKVTVVGEVPDAHPLDAIEVHKTKDGKVGEGTKIAPPSGVEPGVPVEALIAVERQGKDGGGKIAVEEISEE